MDKSELQQQLIEKKQYMFSEGFLDDEFRRIESLEDRQPDFIESIIHIHVPSTAEYIHKMEAILGSADPCDLRELERLMLKLRGASASFGAAKVTTATDDLLFTFRSDQTNISGTTAALARVRFEHNALKSNLEPYAEMLAKLRGDAHPPPDAESDSNEDAESIGSNFVPGV